MRKWILMVGSLLVLWALSACGPKSMVVLVPDPDGSVGRISVSNAAGSVEMEKAHQQTVVRGTETAPAEPVPIDRAEVEELFEAALASQPPAPLHFVLYFESDAVVLRPESRLLLPGIVRVIRQRMPTAVSVVGHSDTKGDKDYNLALSLRRARAVEEQLVALGAPATTIEISSHGEENPLVKTADNVANARNRRVEVIVR
jgi:outer membrane protein OmpA-like peptidoglycan-associated protein